MKDAVHKATGQEVLVHFSVRDTGIGISKENISRLFQSFSQVRAVAKYMSAPSRGVSDLQLAATPDASMTQGAASTCEAQPVNLLAETVVYMEVAQCETITLPCASLVPCALHKNQGTPHWLTASLHLCQVDASPTRRYGGSGLGLAISQKLAEAMGGRMWAQSGGIEQGTTFRWTMACRLAPEAEPAGHSGQQHARGQEAIGQRSGATSPNAKACYIKMHAIISWSLSIGSLVMIRHW